MLVWMSSVSPMDPLLCLCRGLNTLCIYQGVSTQRDFDLGTFALRREAGKGRGKRMVKKILKLSPDPFGF